MPGRKTDVKDSEWIADLVRHGLIAKSFVPPKPIRALRALVRYRRKLVESCSTERNRLRKLLETGNIKLASVASNVFGVSGMAMLRALAANTATPTAMAELARGTLRTKIPALVLALDGRLDEEHRFLLPMQLDRLGQVGEHLAALDRCIDQQLAPLRDAHTRLKTVPGIDRIIAFRILAEIGTDMAAFASADDLASWAGICPGNHETAGKRHRGTTRSGNVHLTTALVEAAQAAIRTKGSYLREKFHRLRVRRGYNRRRGRHRAQDPHRRLPHAPHRHRLPRPGRGLPRPHRRTAHDTPARPAVGEARLRRPAIRTPRYLCSLVRPPELPTGCPDVRSDPLFSVAGTTFPDLRLSTPRGSTSRPGVLQNGAVPLMACQMLFDGKFRSRACTSARRGRPA